MLKELFTELYKKLETEKENDKKSKNGYFEFFVYDILEKDEYKNANFSITSKAVKNYYEKYVGKKENKSGEPKSELKNLIAIYLGFTSYADFENSHTKQATETSSVKSANKTLAVPHKNRNENKLEISENAKSFIKKHKKSAIGVGIASILSVFFLSNYYYTKDAENCIIWRENHFEKTSCNQEDSINNKIFKVDIENFKQVAVTNESEFFKNGNPLIWYGKSEDNKMEFFNHRGIHPKTLKELDPITPYIIAKYVPAESIDKPVVK